MIGCLQTCVRKQPIIALYFEFETVLKFITSGPCSYLCRLGHQDSITGIDSLTRERAITAGGQDSSIRIWKVVEESQLVFHGHM